MKCEDLDKVDVSVSSFDSVSFDDCILHVPSGTRWAYRHHPVFSKYKNIVTERYE